MYKEMDWHIVLTHTRPVQYSTVQYSTLQHSTAKAQALTLYDWEVTTVKGHYSTVQYSTLQYSMVQYGTVRIY